jgi:hypothetical protein
LPHDVFGTSRSPPSPGVIERKWFDLIVCGVPYWPPGSP